MLQITTDISTLSRAQREAVSSFVLNFPESTPAGDEDDEELVTFTGLVALDEPSPEAAFASTGATLVPGDLVTERLDKSGIPWDERIHASSRAKTADGCWRKKRGVDEPTVAKVEAELKALMAIPTAPVGAVQVPAPPAIAIVPPPPPPPPAAVADRNAFVALITMASNAIGAKKLTQEQLTAAVVAAGVPSLPLLGNRLDLVPQVTAAIETIIACAA